MAFCRNCGKEIDDKAVICVHCGVPISSKYKSGNTNAASQAKNMMYKSAQSIGAILIVLGAIGVLVALVLCIARFSDLQLFHKLLFAGFAEILIVGIAIYVIRNKLVSKSIKNTKTIKAVILLTGIITILSGIIGSIKFYNDNPFLKTENGLKIKLEYKAAIDGKSTYYYNYDALDLYSLFFIIAIGITITIISLLIFKASEEKSD